MTEDLTARLVGLGRAMAAPLPTPEELAAGKAEDRALADRIHKARPGVPTHLAYGVLEALRTIRHVDAAKAEQRVAELEAEQQRYEETVVGELTETITRLSRQVARAEAEPAKVDQVLRDHGFEYPLGAAGVRDMAAQRQGFLDDLKTAERHIRAVRRLHDRYRDVEAVGDNDSCAHCNQLTGRRVPWPCPTIQALEQP